MDTIKLLEFSWLLQGRLIVEGAVNSICKAWRITDASLASILLLETLLNFNTAFKKFSGESFILDASDVGGSDRAVQERTRSMVIQIKEGAQIENPRSYSPQEVKQLRHLLATGGVVQRDPRRENFYEIEGNGEIFYIHISPISGAVVLLAKWNRQPVDCCFNSEHLIA